MHKVHFRYRCRHCRRCCCCIAFQFGICVVVLFYMTNVCVCMCEQVDGYDLRERVWRVWAATAAAAAADDVVPAQKLIATHTITHIAFSNCTNFRICVQDAISCNMCARCAGIFSFFSFLPVFPVCITVSCSGFRYRFLSLFRIQLFNISTPGTSSVRLCYTEPTNKQTVEMKVKTQNGRSFACYFSKWKKIFSVKSSIFFQIFF